MSNLHCCLKFVDRQNGRHLTKWHLNQMTAVFIITPKNRTPQSLRHHSAPAYQQWQTMITARSGRVCVETLLSM